MEQIGIEVGAAIRRGRKFAGKFGGEGGGAEGISKSLVAPNHGPLLSVSFTPSWIIPRASVAGGVSRPRSGALVKLYRALSYQ